MTGKRGERQLVTDVEAQVRGCNECPKNTFSEARGPSEGEIASATSIEKPTVPTEKGDRSGSGRPATTLVDRNRASQKGRTPIMTVDDVCQELGIARSTFYEWLRDGRGPRSYRLPNGARRIFRADVEQWLHGLAEGGADA